jgi:hypothetical protein
MPRNFNKSIEAFAAGIPGGRGLVPVQLAGSSFRRCEQAILTRKNSQAGEKYARFLQGKFDQIKAKQGDFSQFKP